MTKPPPSPPSDAFLRVLEALLRPLVRALISQGVTAPALYRLIKQTYVQVAESDFTLDGKSQTDSRINVLTGVHRRDVRSFRENRNGFDPSTRRQVTTIASVIGRWLADPDLTDDEGLPLPLPRFGPEPRSFEALVASISRDVRPRTILDELRRQDLVMLEEGDDVVALKTDAFLGPADLEQKIHFFADNVGDHLSAAVENLLAEDPRFMERAVFYNRLSEASITEIEETARALGSDALLKLNKLAHARQEQDMKSEVNAHRFRFGVFFYKEDEAGAPEAPDTSKARQDE